MSTHILSRAQRSGMTLIEVMIAIIIVTSAALSLGVFVGQFSHASTLAAARTVAVELAGSRLEMVRGAKTYAGIDSLATTEASLPGYSGYTRQTYVQRVGGGNGAIYDYKVITVTVTAPTVTSPVEKTTMIASF